MSKCSPWHFATMTALIKVTWGLFDVSLWLITLQPIKISLNICSLENLIKNVGRIIHQWPWPISKVTGSHHAFSCVLFNCSKYCFQNGLMYIHSAFHSIIGSDLDLLKVTYNQLRFSLWMITHSIYLLQFHRLEHINIHIWWIISFLKVTYSHLGFSFLDDLSQPSRYCIS